MISIDSSLNLRGPYYVLQLNMSLQNRIVDYLFHSMGGKSNRETIRRYIPNAVGKWSNVRIEGGDRIRCAIAQGGKLGIRDSSFVRVSCIFLSNTMC